MSFLTKLSLQNRSVVALAVVAIIIAGVFAVTSLHQELIPNLNFPFMTVVTLDPGAAPGDVERNVTTPIENSIESLPATEELTSYSNEGMSIIIAQYQFGTDMKETQSQIQAAVGRLQGQLPQGTQPLVETLNFSSLPVMQLAVSSDGSPAELGAVLASKVVPRLQQIPGVQAVTLSGIDQPQLRIELKPKQILGRGVSPQAIVAAVQGANLNASSGSVTSGGVVFPVTVAATTATIAQLEQLVIVPRATAPLSASAGTAGGIGDSMPGGGQTGASASGGAAGATARPPAAPVTLGQVARISVAPAAPTALTRTNGKPSIGIAVSKASDGNTVDIASAIKDQLPQIEQDLGGSATITTVLDQSTYITESITSMWREGLIGAAFAVLVIWLFLCNWRSTIIAGLSIPLSVVVALVVLWGRGDSLNMLTLGGLTIAIGRVIDDSIVVIENTYRHLQEGDDVNTAAYTATREVAGAITASTLTTVAVFLPLGFIQGISSEFFRPFALTVTFALLASLFVALTVVPVVTTWMLKKKQVGHREASDTTRLQRAYLPLLGWATSHKAVTIIAAVAIFVTVMAFGPFLKTNLFDNSADPSMSIDQQLPAGSDLQRTATAALPIENILKDTAGVQTYQVTIGSTGELFGPGGGTNASSSQAQYTIRTDPDSDKTAVVADVRAQVETLDPDEVGSVAVTGEDASFGGGNSTIEVRIAADDPAVLKEANKTVYGTVRTVSGLVNVKSSLTESRPQLTVEVDQKKAALAGVDAQSVSQMVTLVLTGIALGPLPTAEGPIPTLLAVPQFRLPPLPGASTALLERLPMPTAGGGTVPLGRVASVRQAEAPAQVTHVDGKRTATVSASVVTGNVGAESSKVQKALSGVELPAGAEWSMAGAGEETKDVFRTLGIAMVIAVLLVYIIMVATFRSLLNPLILLVSIPFAGVGAVGLMFLTGTSLGMPSLVGLLMLIGIVVTNAIVLLDLVERFRRQGMDARSAVVEGARRRLRPILMTAAATILALIPMALGLGKSAFLSTPLAVVVIGGLFTSTLLTLIIVPVLYLIFDRLRGEGREVVLEARE